MIRPGLGYRPDLPDGRDRPFSAHPLAAQVPAPRSDWRPFVSSILDQGSLSACVGFSWAQALRTGLAIDGVQSPELPSPLAIYFWARAEHGDAYVDMGTYLRTAAAAVKHFGFPPDSAWPQTHAKVNVAPGLNAHRAAFDRKGLRGYYRIDQGDLNGIRVALSAGRPVVFGTEIRDGFFDARGTVDRDTGAVAGGHAMACVGHDESRFLIVNSWNRSWGDDGFVWFTDSRMREARDIWVADFNPSLPGAA